MKVVPTLTYLALSFYLNPFTAIPTVAAKSPGKCRLKPKSGILTDQVPWGTPTSPATYPPGNVPTGTMTSPGTMPTLAKFDYEHHKVIGVNLGGWFVLEPWITPSIFENTKNDAIVDEYTFGQMQRPEVALGVLRRHWETWITDDDFIKMADSGINHVRIPVGYWSVPTGDDPRPYMPGAWPFLLNALRLAHKHGIYTIIDLHGAPGSQNGYDNSGQRTNSPMWAVQPANLTRTINALVYIANRTQGLLDVLELINEPGGFRGADWAANTRQFFLDAYNAVRATVGNNLRIMIGDAFLGVNSWDGFLTPENGGSGVLMDFHQYQIFSIVELSRSMDDHIQNVCSMIPTVKSYADRNIWTVMGEWSAAMTDCTKWLNGRGVGARWDGTWYTPNTPLGSCANVTGPMKNFSPEYKAFLRKYWEAQSVLGDAVNGNVWWTWKAENSDEWDYSKGLDGGWIPKDPTDRMYPNICG